MHAELLWPIAHTEVHIIISSVCCGVLHKVAHVRLLAHYAGGRQHQHHRGTCNKLLPRAAAADCLVESN
jgi:hypothetical protein